MDSNERLTVIEVIYFTFFFEHSASRCGRQFLKPHMHQITPDYDMYFKDFNLEKLESLKVSANQKTPIFSSSEGKALARVDSLEKQVHALQLELTELKVLSETSFSRLDALENGHINITSDIEFLKAAFKSTPRTEEAKLSTTPEGHTDQSEIVNFFSRKFVYVFGHKLSQVVYLCHKNSSVRILRIMECYLLSRLLLNGNSIKN